MNRDLNNGEEKPPIILSDTTTGFETTSKSVELPSSSPTRKNTSNSGGHDGPYASIEVEKTISLEQGNARAYAHTDNASTEGGIPGADLSESKTLPEHQCPGFEKAPTFRPVCSKDLPTINDGGLSRSHSTVPHGANGEDDTYPEGGLRAYSVVFGSFCGMTASFGILNIVGTFQAYLSTHQLKDESPSAIGWVFSVYAFLTFFCGVQIGPIFDAKGPRWLVFPGSVLIFVGLIGVAESTSTFVLSQSTTTPY